jgi:hypothetical protein
MSKIVKSADRDLNQQPDGPLAAGNCQPSDERGRRWSWGSADGKSRVFAGALVIALVVIVAALGMLSFHLAAMRLYQVDECCNVQVARVVAVGGKGVGADLCEMDGVSTS